MGVARLMVIAGDAIEGRDAVGGGDETGGDGEPDGELDTQKPNTRHPSKTLPVKR